MTGNSPDAPRTGGHAGYLRIATEEASAPPELIARFRDLLDRGGTDEYLDAPRFWPILEAAEALDTPIYLHPNTPSRGMIQPLLQAGLDGAIYGFAVETGMHVLRMITAGVFDRFPGSGWSSATSARPCRSGCTGWTTCTRPPSGRGATRP
jgi:Amidohydrolase